MRCEEVCFGSGLAHGQGAVSDDGLLAGSVLRWCIIAHAEKQVSERDYDGVCVCVSMGMSLPTEAAVRVAGDSEQPTVGSGN